MPFTIDIKCLRIISGLCHGISIINTYCDWKDLKGHYLDSKNVAKNKTPAGQGTMDLQSESQVSLGDGGGGRKLGKDKKVANYISEPHGMQK